MSAEFLLGAKEFAWHALLLILISHVSTRWLLINIGGQYSVILVHELVTALFVLFYPFRIKFVSNLENHIVLTPSEHTPVRMTTFRRIKSFLNIDDIRG